MRHTLYQCINQTSLTEPPTSAAATKLYRSEVYKSFLIKLKSSNPNLATRFKNLPPNEAVANPLKINSSSRRVNRLRPKSLIRLKKSVFFSPQKKNSPISWATL